MKSKLLSKGCLLLCVLMGVSANSCYGMRGGFNQTQARIAQQREEKIAELERKYESARTKLKQERAAHDVTVQKIQKYKDNVKAGHKIDGKHNKGHYETLVAHLNQHNTARKKQQEEKESKKKAKPLSPHHKE